MKTNAILGFVNGNKLRRFSYVFSVIWKLKMKVLFHFKMFRWYSLDFLNENYRQIGENLF